MTYRGDIALGSTLDIKFCTVGTTGAPTTLSGVPVISAYPDNSTTELTAGITLTVDFDARTGMNHVRVVASNGNGYAAGSNYQLVITTGTVGGTSVVGYVVAEFSIEARSALRPATAGRTLVVDAAGLADANTVKLGPSGAGTAQTARDVGASVIAASVTGNVGGNVVGSVASVTARVTANTDQLAGQTVTAAAGVTFPTSVASPTNITAGTITNATNVTNGVTLAANAVDSVALATSGAQKIADVHLDRDMSVGTDSGSPTVRTPRQALRVLRNKTDIPNGTVYKEDDTTASWTFATTTAAGNPVTVVDPA